VIIGNIIDATTIDRNFLSEDWVKKLGLLKINLLPKKNTLLVKFLQITVTKYSSFKN